MGKWANFYGTAARRVPASEGFGMATMSNILLEKEILLESGTNELELLVFEVADYTFGINVAKVREILPTAEITNLQGNVYGCTIFASRP